MKIRADASCQGDEEMEGCDMSAGCCFACRVVEGAISDIPATYLYDVPDIELRQLTYTTRKDHGLSGARTS